jgi:hypothetical protein
MQRQPGRVSKRHKVRHMHFVTTASDRLNAVIRQVNTTLRNPRKSLRDLEVDNLPLTILQKLNRPS